VEGEEPALRVAELKSPLLRAAVAAVLGEARACLASSSGAAGSGVGVSARGEGGRADAGAGVRFPPPSSLRVHRCETITVIIPTMVTVTVAEMPAS